MTVSAQHGPELPNDDVPTEELADRKDVRPIASADELAEAEAFESDEELEQFLADLYTSRQVDAG